MLVSGQTGVRNRVVRLILSRTDTIVIRQRPEGFELTGPDGEDTVRCDNWPETERLLVRLGIPEEKLEEILLLIQPGTEIIVRRKFSH